MAANYQEIDMTTWKRAMHCAVFRNSVQPQYCVSFSLDITHFLQEVRAHQLSFTFALVYAASKCANEMEEFRYRFVDGKVVLFDRIDTSFTYLDNKTELFKVVNVAMQDNLRDYIQLAKSTVEQQKAYFTGPLETDIFQFSAMPWVSFTHISHTDSGKRDNATPLFDWGKYFLCDGRVLLPFSVQVHHSFVDGIHIGKLAARLQEFLDHFDPETD